jgi:UDP-N-acetylglucosamine--N-acetylmuramyl-(pentapeptide) pyrophosphoryl-undecaprenol N-acetylglucosamine transferase
VPVILVFGGSQGSITLNLSLSGGMIQLAGKPVQVIWQTGRAFKPEAESKVNDSGALNIRVFDFINEMDKAYSAADLVVARSGALTLSELALVGKPAILVPLPSAAGDHQTKNAMNYVREGAAIVVPDTEATERLVGMMLEFVMNPEQLTRMGRKMQIFGKPEATRQIAAEALKLC